MTRGGPWHARRMTFGDAYMDRLQALWREELELTMVKAAVKTNLHREKQVMMDAARDKDDDGSACMHPENNDPTLGGQIPWAPLIHAPRARIMVFKRRFDAGTFSIVGKL